MSDLGDHELLLNTNFRNASYRSVLLDSQEMLIQAEDTGVIGRVDRGRSGSGL